MGAGRAISHESRAKSARNCDQTRSNLPFPHSDYTSAHTGLSCVYFCYATMSGAALYEGTIPGTHHCGSAMLLCLVWRCTTVLLPATTTVILYPFDSVPLRFYSSCSSPDWAVVPLCCSALAYSSSPLSDSSMRSTMPSTSGELDFRPLASDTAPSAYADSWLRLTCPACATTRPMSV